MISALRLLQQNNILHVHAVLVGKGFQKEDLQQQAKNLSNITFLDSIPKAQVLSFLSLIDVAFIGWKSLPIYKYGVSPNKIFEYMLANKPILHATDTSFDVVEKSGCGVSVPAEQPELLANALIKLSEMSSQELVAMGAKGAPYVYEYHDYHRLAERYTKLFD